MHNLRYGVLFLYIIEMFLTYAKVLNTAPVEAEIAALTGTIEEYGKALESGMVDPEENIPKFLQALEENGVSVLLEEIQKQLDEWKSIEK